MTHTLTQLDHDFCNLCVAGGRQWESGTTALTVALMDGQYIVGNVGDSRAITSRVCKTSKDAEDLARQGWNRTWRDSKSIWKEVSHVHCPSRKDEKARIHASNGWTTKDKTVLIPQSRDRWNLGDDARDVVPMFEGILDQWDQINRTNFVSRICGELAVSRSLGDRDYKVSFQKPLSQQEATRSEIWEGPCFLPFPPGHNQMFQGDLVTNTPEFCTIPMGGDDTCEEFLLMACDGLWDVLDPLDVVSVVRQWLFNCQYSPKKTARLLSKLAVCLGSSDNITIIIVLTEHHTPQMN
mmetsp:Transcript_31080/g.64853  ORF Transcript_31080/g.64853 Transcript_31080/m.64853 type:complete len:295 (-) Transcript_31080:248-1132(-)